MARPSSSAARLIQGVRVKPLRVVPDERGRLVEMLDRNDPLFLAFGNVYCTTVNRGVVKGWHYHRKQIDHFVCVSGMIKLVLYDGRPGSPTRGRINEWFLGVHNPLLVRIPARVHHGFKGLTDPEAVVVNISTEPYHRKRPDESRLDPHHSQIPYDWNRKDG